MSNFSHNSSLKGETAAATTDEIMHLYELYGESDYDGEPVSHTSHMVQCAMHAMKNINDTELILGAFLHDIGHLLKHNQDTQSMGNYGVVNHEWLGAQYLHERGFSERMSTIVGMHVHAKRYLVTTNSDYAKKLSDASWETLHYQGGLMAENEISQFEQHPFFKDIISVRMWDEESKDTEAKLLPLNYFWNMILEYLILQKHETNS
jgi:2-amino-1-hydroxyethylphosphonate dioxygenase (glycine-forming)